MDQKKTGALIRVLRLEKGLTQQGLAELLGVSNRAVSKWERGRGPRTSPCCPPCPSSWAWIWPDCSPAVSRNPTTQEEA